MYDFVQTNSTFCETKKHSNTFSFIDFICVSIAQTLTEQSKICIEVRNEF